MPANLPAYAHESRSFINYCPKPKTTGMFFSGWMGKHSIVCWYNWILLSNKKEQTTDICNSEDGDLKDIMLSGGKKASIGNLHTIWFYSYNIPEQVKLGTDHWLAGIKGGCRAWLQRGSHLFGITELFYYPDRVVITHIYTDVETQNCVCRCVYTHTQSF